MVRKSPDPGQLEVLRWVANGCPEGVMTGFTYKTTAVALQNRHLVKVSKRGGWHAVLTDDGRYYLEHGTYPDAPPIPGPPQESGEGKPRQAKVSVRKTKSLKAETASGIAAESAGVDAGSPPLAADSKPVKIDVPVPSQLRDAHPVIAALRDTAGHFELGPLVRNRALRILQGLAVAAEREGYQVREVRWAHRSGYSHPRPDSLDHIVIETGETSVEVRMFQQSDRVAHTPTAKEVDANKRWGASIPKYDHTPNDKLRLELDRGWHSRRRTWRDGVRGPLEQKLGSVLAEVALRDAEAHDRRIKSDEAAAEREKMRQVAIERAKLLLRESHRGDVLVKQAAAWRQSSELRHFIEAMSATAERLTDLDEKDAAYEWIAWATQRAEALDPLLRPLRTPDDPEPTAEALRPFLRW